MMNQKSHYETLGIDKEASVEDIKKAFRELSMKTHPDVAEDKSQGERFKLISEAYRVLSNKRDRRLYDLEVEEATRFGGFRYNPHAAGGKNHDFAGFAGGRPGQQQPNKAQEGLHGILDTMFRPRNIFLTLTVGTAALFAIRAYNHYDTEQDRIKRHKGGQSHVEAWFNPKSNRWELPAPWDPTYRKLQPKLQFVPRDDVRPAR